MSNTIIIGIVFTIISVGIILIFKAKDNKRAKEAYIARQADIKANPQNYFVSEGGWKTDPIAEDVL